MTLAHDYLIQHHAEHTKKPHKTDLTLILFTLNLDGETLNSTDTRQYTIG